MSRSSLRPSLVTSLPTRYTASTRYISSTPSTSLEHPYLNPWSKFRSHLKPPITLPTPLPALYRQKVILTDGSIFYTHTTAPSPQTITLTRDVANNALWAPGTEKRGLSDAEDGSVGRFRRRFGGTEIGAVGVEESGGEESVGKREFGFGEGDLDWMSEGGVAVAAPKVPEKKVVAGKGGKKK